MVADSAYGVAVQVAAAVAGEASNAITGNFLRQDGTGKLWAFGTESGSLLSDWNALGRTGSDSSFAGGYPTMPLLDAAWLTSGFTLHSALMTAPAASGISMLVAHDGAKDVTGTADGAWIAGDGRDNILTAVAGSNMLSAGSGDAVLIGGSGADLLFGGAGDVLMLAGAGGALMIGGSGRTRG